MAGVLTVVAEEMGRIVGLVWGGVGVAIKLNNQVMTTVFKVTSRIVQLLLLLTQKTADLMSIIFTDLLLFLADVGNAVLAVGVALRSAVYIFCSLLISLYQSIICAATYAYQLVQTSYMAVISGIVGVMAQLGNALTIIKHAFVLFGSSILFIVGLIPNLICLVFSGLLYLLSYTCLKCNQAVNSLWLSLCYLSDLCVSTVVNFFCDIPLEAVIGVIIGVGIIIGLKYTVSYMMDNLIVIPDFPIPSFFLVTRQQLLQWYTGIVRRARQRPPVEVETEEEDVDDANDENGNDNNDNVPDLNLPQNQQYARYMNQEPPPEQPQQVANHQPETQAQPIIPQLQARRPITRQRLREQPQQNLVAGGAEANGMKSVRESSDIIDVQAYHLYRELEQEREDRLCVVCQDQVKRVILLPCRHLCLCDACRSAIITRDNTCPVCRRPIMETLRVFV